MFVLHSYKQIQLLLVFIFILLKHKSTPKYVIFKTFNVACFTNPHYLDLF